MAKSSGTGAKVDGAHRKHDVSPELAGVVGSGQFSRAEVVKGLWDYIKKHKLQAEDNKRDIVADAKLEKVFGKKRVNMFEMNKLISAHIK